MLPQRGLAAPPARHRPALRLPSPAGILDRLRAAQGLLTGLVLLLAWEGAVRLLDVPAWTLPAPSRVLATLIERWDILVAEAAVTASETLLGFLAGALCGGALALVMAASPWLERSVNPVLVVSQAIPVMALAPLLVVWMGFGMAPKIVMAGLVIFFPVAANFHEGLRRTDPGLVDLGRLYGASPGRLLWLVRIPAALPLLAAGLRMAAAFAPIGAVIGEYVGASAGLGLLMLHANARMQTDLMFAALVILVAFTLALWALVGWATRRLVHWAPDTLAP